MKKLDEFRRKIDDLDEELSRLINERLKVVGEIGKEKSKNSTPVFDGAREREVLAHVEGLVDDDKKKYVKRIYRTVFSVGREYQTNETERANLRRFRAALLGESLGYSYSKIIHESLGYKYDLLEVQPYEIPDILFSGVYGGFNVTAPYKQTVIEYLDELDDAALQTRVVNTVKFQDGRAVGYNTDVVGMRAMIVNAGIDLKGKTVGILGTGGTSKTAQFVAAQAGAKEIVTVGRSSRINYENCYEIPFDVIINTTPVGTYPNTDETALDLRRIKGVQAVADVVYNPLRSKLICTAKEMGLKVAYGLEMLVRQATASCGIFLDESIDENENARIMRDLRHLCCGVTFVGMPGSGKSTLAKATAQMLGKDYIDTDAEVEKLFGKTVEEIFDENGEAVFRATEERVIASAMKKNAVVSVGGGAVLSERNRFAMMQNSVIIHVERDLNNLATDGRPLSKSKAKLIEIYNERMPIYRDLGDFSINNDGDINSATEQIKKILL